MYEYAMLLTYEDGTTETLFPQVSHYLYAVKACRNHAKAQARELAADPMFLGYRQSPAAQVAA